MLTDTHTHLYLEDFNGESEDVVRRAIEAGVERMIFPNVDLNTIAPMKALAAKFPDNTFMAMGLHPTELADNWREQLDIVKSHLTDGTRYVAIGEIGMDLYWDASRREEQMIALDTQVHWAIQHNLPVIIHCREALQPTLEVLEKYRGNGLRGVFHSFGGTVDDVAEIRRRAGDFYFGINGIVTFRNCKVRDCLTEIGTDRLLLETDSPYLAPVPLRGKRNESAYIVHTAAHAAHVLGMTPGSLADITSANASVLFGL